MEDKVLDHAQMIMELFKIVEEQRKKIESIEREVGALNSISHSTIATVVELKEWLNNRRFLI